jgi:hypothetical protein
MFWQGKYVISFVCHILQDFLVIERKSELFSPKFQQSHAAMLLTFNNLNIPIAPRKNQGPPTGT